MGLNGQGQAFPGSEGELLGSTALTHSPLPSCALSPGNSDADAVKPPCSVQALPDLRLDLPRGHR